MSDPSGAAWLAAGAGVVAAIGTVGNIGYLAWQHVKAREREDAELVRREEERRTAQARRVSVRRRDMGVDVDGTTSMRIRIRNGSDDPIYNVMVWADAAAIPELANQTMIAKVARVEGRDEKTLTATVSYEAPMNLAVALEFTDDARRRWLLDSHGLHESDTSDDMLFSLMDDDEAI